jgi:hypothetical protein
LTGFLAAIPAFGAGQAIATQKYEGAVTCQSSLCHGGSSPIRGEFVNWIWAQQDEHSHAYMTLVQSRSARMGDSLGIKNPASDNRCTACHAPLALVAREDRAPTAHVEEGVSCESCHAPAGAWLRSHTRPDYTYEQRVASGMADLKSLYVRANDCVACHQNIDSALLGAGHPILFFELDRQTQAEPPHWKDPEPWSGLRAWLVGQCVAFREVSWKLASGAGDPNARAQWNSLHWLLETLHSSLGLSWTTAPLPRDPGDYQGWVAIADDLARQAQKKPWSREQARTGLTQLASASRLFSAAVDDSSEADFYRLKRIAFAVDSLQGALNDPNLKPIADELVYLSLQPANFIPDKVSAALSKLSEALSSPGK